MTSAYHPSWARQFDWFAGWRRPTFDPTPQDIQLLKSIRHAVNRAGYYGLIDYDETGKMLVVIDRLLASYGGDE